MQECSTHNAMPITICEADACDVETLQHVGRQTFMETFAERNTAENMQRYLEDNFGREQVLEELANPHSRFYLAWDGGTPIGYLKVNFGQAQTDVYDEDSLEIQRIYVLQAYHGKKVGQMFYEKALEIALAEKKAYLWLGVWEENFRAMRFYQKNGFVAFSTHPFVMGDDVQTDILMKKPLV